MALQLHNLILLTRGWVTTIHQGTLRMQNGMYTLRRHRQKKKNGTDFQSIKWHTHLGGHLGPNLWGHGPLVWFTRNSAVQATVLVLCHFVGCHVDCWSNLCGESSLSSPFMRNKQHSEQENKNIFQWKGSASQQLLSSGKHTWLRGHTNLGGTSPRSEVSDTHSPLLSDEPRAKEN